jgi:hypothetical protein
MNQPIDIVLIGAIRYPVERITGLHDAGKKLDGWVQYRPYSIQIDDALGEQGERVVLWHEILHAILAQAGFDDYDEEHERFIDALAYGIYQVLEDNSGLRYS